MGQENKYPHTRIYHNKYLTELREEDITPQLIEDMNKLMTSMGYDVNSDIPIWKQFHIRHGLSIQD